MSSKRERYINMLAAIAGSPGEVPLKKLVRTVLDEGNLEGCRAATEHIPFHFWYLGETYAVYVRGDGWLRVESYAEGGGLDARILEDVLNTALEHGRQFEVGIDMARSDSTDKPIIDTED